MIRHVGILSIALAVLCTRAAAQDDPAAARLAPDQTCSRVTPAYADASAGTPNVAHDGSPLADISPPDISQGFRGIPRSGQPPLTPSQQRILECSYFLPEANAEMPYALFIPSGDDPVRPMPVVVNLHGLNITPLMQILFDGTTDFAEERDFIVVAPMGYSVGGWWGSRPSSPHLGARYNDLWAGVAPIAGAGGIRDRESAERLRSLPMLIMHGELDPIVPAATSRRSVWWLQFVGAPHLYLEAPGMDHEFWIRRGGEHMEKVFLFFDMVSRASTVSPVSEVTSPAEN